MEARTLPLDVRRMRESRIYVCVCVNLGEKRERELIQKMLQMPKISFFFFFFWNSRRWEGIYSEFVMFCLVHTGSFC